MKIGGNAFNCGVNFVSDRYRAKVVVTAEGCRVKLTEKMAGKNRRTERLLAVLKAIPLVRGPVSLVENNKIFLLLFVTAAAIDFVYYLEGTGSIAGGTAAAALLLIEFAVFIGATGYILVRLLRQGRNTRRFHGAEHKTIGAYESGEELTLETARKASRVSKRCGTELVVFVLCFYAPLSYALPTDGLAMILAFSLGYEVFRIPGGDRLPVLSWLFKLGYFLQKHLFTAEPTDSQLAAAVAAVKTLAEAEKAAGKAAKEAESGFSKN